MTDTSAAGRVIVVTDATFPEVVSSHGVLLVDVWAPWCQPCHRFAPIFAAAAAECEDPDVGFAKLDIDDNQQVPGVFGVMSIPTLLGFRDGLLVFRKAGPVGRRELGRVVAQIREVDPERVRAELRDR